MKNIVGAIVILVLITSACSTRNNYQVSAHLTPQQQDAMMQKIIRYVGRAPEGLTLDERFNNRYDSVYQEQARLHKFDAYFIKGNTHYFLVSRRAPSLIEKRVATGGKFILDDDQHITEYEEVFRTWKMVPNTLAKREMVLFDKFVKGESLAQYAPTTSADVEYIEFPDAHTYFDKAVMQWKTK